MNANALRTWGIAVGSALMAGALALSVLGPDSAAVRTQTEGEGAAAEAEAAPVSFLARFRGGGPIARAQSAAARGQTEAAQRQIERQLQRQSAFAGLCFDRFTAGAAEIVLRTCEPVPANERAGAEARWLARLQAMRAVAYADANTSASAE